MNTLRKNKGFTLIELMIIVAIIAILAAIAIPNYTEYIIRGRIAEAAAALSDTRTKMEQFFQDNRTYAGACVAGTLAPLPAATPYFTFNCDTNCAGGTSSLSATNFQINACGRGKMEDFAFSINQANTRATVAVPAGWTPSASCWVMNKAGGC